MRRSATLIEVQPQNSLTKFLLARHGETEWNVAGRRQGRLDSPLTAAGRAHAQQIAADLEDEFIDAIFCSPLGRAQVTAEFIAERHSLPITVVDELAELDMGLFAGLTDHQIEAQFPGAFTERSLDKYSWCFPDGESYRDLDRRSAIAIRTIKDSGANAPLIVGHSMSARMLLRNLLDLEPDEALQFSLPHGVALEIRPGCTNKTRWLPR